jgi:5-methylcytosine-specific restriction protein A
MPYKPPHPCARPGCAALTRGRYCEKHEKEEAARYEKQERNPRHGEFYGNNWRRVRAIYLAAHPVCEVCESEGRLTPATLVHHKKPIAEGGSNRESNLMAICLPCHSRLHGRQGDYFT